MNGGDVVAAAFWVLSSGGLLILIWLFTIVVAVLAGFGWGRRWQARWAVDQAVQQELEAFDLVQLPAQRREQD